MTAVETPLCAVDGCAIPHRHTPTCTTDGCRGCLPARASDGLRLCRWHTRTLGEDALVAVIRWRQLGEVLAQGMTGVLGEVVTVRADPNLVLRTQVVDARGEIVDALAGLSRLVAAERGLAGGIPGTVAGLGRLVAAHHVWLAGHTQAGVHAALLREVTGRGYRVAFPSKARRFMITDPRGHTVGCPEWVADEGHLTRCPGGLWTVLRPTDDLLPSELLCDAHPGTHRWPASAWIRLGRRLLGATA